MKKLIATIILIISSTYSYAEIILAKVVFNIKNEKVIAIILNTDEKIKKEKCEKQIMSDKGKYMMKMITKNKKEEVIKITFKCNI